MSAHIVTAEEAQKRLAVAEWIVEHGVWRSPQAEQLLILNERVRDLAHTVVVQAEQIAAVLALHTSTGVNQFDPVNGAFVYGDDDEMIVTHRLCEGCTLDLTLELLGDCEWSEDADGNVYYPCPTARALGVTA